MAVRVVVQRVSEASVRIGGDKVSRIGEGILVLAAFRRGDTPEELDWMARKCLELRIFEDEAGKMNRSLLDIQGEAMIVSQFTLYGNCMKGRRPAYTDSAPADEARKLYRQFVDTVAGYYPRVAEGEFGARMEVDLVNSGPVTLVIDREAGSG